MANFKRRRHKNARAGCLLCKPHKGNGMCADHMNMRHGDRRRYLGQTYGLREFRAERCDGPISRL